MFLRVALPAFVVALSGALGVVGCSSQPEVEEEEQDEGELVLSRGVDAPIVVPAPGTMLTELSQPSLMTALEAGGHHFASHFGVATPLDNRALSRAGSLYDFIANDVAADLDAQRARDPKLRTQVSHGTTRILDKGWLRADYARFELAGVIPRADRMDETSATCGEVRFLYRLAYTFRPNDPARVSYSRLPVVMNVVYDVPRTSLEDCTRFAARWQVPTSVTDESSYLGYLTSELLSLTKLRFKQVELNAQVLRVPSESKTDMGGVAEYTFRIYGLPGGAPALLPLENTPDVAKLSADPALKAELAQYLREHVSEVDVGTLKLPAKFLATKASAFSTFGSARLANKPFSQLYWDSSTRDAPLLAGVDYATQASYVGSAAGLVARLDDLTCVGCHQSGRSVAGFHFLGEDSLARSHPLNVVRVGKSPHLIEELRRRSSFMQSLAKGATTSPFRPMAFAAAGTAARGAPCVAGSATAAFKTVPSCAPGLVCTSLAENPRVPVELGQCLPALSGTGPKATYATEFAGLPCSKGVITDAADPRQDVMTNTRFACPARPDGPGYTCRPPEIGVPGGLCTQVCGNGNVPRDREHELCAYAGGKEFDECADRNDFSTCLAGAIKSGLREACDETTPCREDWICQRFIKARTMPPEAPADGRGYCVPTYFLFQVRVDGHPNPTPIR